MSIFGGFCYVALNFFIIFFLTQRVSLFGWTQKEMFVLLGSFYILTYAMFLFFWRGFINLIRGIRDGTFDYYLTRPVDSQFLISAVGGGIHNLLALIFGIFVVFYGVNLLQINLSLFQIIAWAFAIIVSVVACYSYVLLLITLNFKYGYIEEVLDLGFSFQNASKYPLDAFTKLPIYLLLFTLPFSALTTIPTHILIDTIFPTQMFVLFIGGSILFIILVRLIWLRSLKSYTSSS